MKQVDDYDEDFVWIKDKTYFSFRYILPQLLFAFFMGLMIGILVAKVMILN